MGSNIPYAPLVERFTCSKEFSYLGEYFMKNDHYTNVPEGTHQYRQFWDDVRIKCLYGMTNSVGISITGHHFFYLNFVQILGKDSETGKKKKIFPRFLDVDYDYFHIVDYARRNEKGVILVKPRRLGFSYKAAAICAHEFTFFRDSKSVVSAFLSNYSQNTMNMVLDNLNFLNAHTEYRRQRSPDTATYIKSQYQTNIGGVTVWKGYKSEVKMLTFKDNPYASVGLTASYLLMDEAGIFPNIVEAYNMSEPAIKDGADYIGVALIFGSAGSMETGTQYFYEMFMNPFKYNMLEFPNPDGELNNMGWFVSSSRGRLGKNIRGESMVDEEGNSNELLATEDILRERESKKSGGDSKAYKNITTQYPLTYKEAFLRSNSNIFPTLELAEWLVTVETSAKLRSQGKPVELYFDSENKIKGRLAGDSEPILDFPLKPDDNKTGCIVIYEEPETFDGSIPYGLYIGGCDPYDQDKSTTVSLGSFFIYKTFISANRTYNQVVAEYTGRPEFADSFYENCRRLCIYYNAKCLYENQLKGLKVYFETKHCLHYLYETPGILKDIVKDSKVQRGYGIHMNRGALGASGIKDQCELYVKQWLLEERTDIDGKKILNLHTILSIPLLKELIAYDRENNFDRIIAFMLCILQAKDSHRLKLTEEGLNEKPDEFFSKNYFKKRKPNI